MPFLDTIKLGFGSNLIIGNASPKLTLDRVSEKAQKDAEALEVESFGLFDTNTANYNTYYPDVTAEDLAPKDNEFIYPVFRALSEVVVHKEWNPVDFGRNGVLKKSLSLLKGATVNADHETAIGNAMGAVMDVSWENSYKAKNGVLIPAGINAKFKLDGKSHPRVARAIMMDPPAIHSTSVTVQFLWEKSHTNLTSEEFFAKLGTYDADGKLITRVATDVKRYHEISLVSHGADPYAQLVNEKGEITNPTWADVSYNSANPTKLATKYFIFDFKSDLLQNSAEPSIPSPIINNDNNSTGMKEYLIALAAILGVTVDAENPQQDVVTNALSALVNDKTQLTDQLTTAQGEVTRLQGELEAATKNSNPAEVTQLQARITEFTDTFRQEVLKNYNIVAKGAPQAAVTELIQKADYATLKAFNTQFSVQLEADFPLHCGECGSNNVSRSSATSSQGEENKEKTNKPYKGDVVQYAADRRKKMDAEAIKRIHS
jgi:hypothetical protein